MTLTSIKQVDPGTLISFRSKNANDLVVWQGTLEAVGTYRLIRDYANPSAYNEAVRQTDPSVPSDVTLLTYFLITVDNAANQPIKQIFADEWIQAGSLVQVNLGNFVTLQIQDPFSNVQTILSVLANAGYASKIIN